MDPKQNTGWDPTWDEVFRGQEWGKYPPEHVIRFVARYFYKVPDRSQVRILDFGCGPGSCTWYMAREGFSASGIDGSPTAIRQATERLKREKLSADFKVGDYIELPWPDAYFDAVIDNFSLYGNRLAACHSAIRQIERVLKPGGRFLSCNFTDRCWGYGSGLEIEPDGFADIQEGPLRGKGFSQFFSRSRLDELYRPFPGFKVEKISFTADEMRHVVESWIVEAQKSGTESAPLFS